jgi:hypothetical protein
LGGSLTANFAIAKVTGNAPDAERLVSEALAAEAAGDADRREALLAEAIQVAPDYQPARWHSGQILVDNDWRPIEEAQRAAAVDPRRVEYQRLREAGGNGLESQIALAKWCRKNGLIDESRFHWRTVLSHGPNNDEALRALGVRWYGGRLLTFAEIDAEKARQREARRAAKKFAPQVAQWERLLSAGDLASRDKALDEIRALRNTAAIPLVEELTLDQKLKTHAKFERAMQVGLALVDALDKVPNQAATQSLVRHALFAEVASVKSAAVDALKRRPMHDYVPLLLSGLAMPIESSFRVATDSDGSVHYWHSLYREGPDASWSVEGRYSAMQMDLQGPSRRVIVDRTRNRIIVERTPAPVSPAVTGELAAVAALNQQRLASQGIAAQRQTSAINQTIEAANALIYPVLTAATGLEIDTSPRKWWDWWEQYNEYYSDGDDPVYERHYADSTHRYYRPPTYSVEETRKYSCFAAGTLVWTITGQRPIETLEIGDLVLAQDADTGELAYKPIVGRTMRPPSKTVKLAVMNANEGSEEIQTTLGHPLWVAGVGWRMAKELGDGAILHSVGGPARIESIAAADEIEAYNLVVADFNTYFVGESGILAHDNTPRAPTAAVVPGLAAD